MSARIFFKNYKMALGILAVFFIFLSITIHLYHNFFMFRLLRGIICYTTLFYLLIAHGKNIQKWVVGFLFFYGASSIITVWFEKSTIAIISMVLNVIVFLLLLWYVLLLITFKKLINSSAQL